MFFRFYFFPRVHYLQKFWKNSQKCNFFTINNREFFQNFWSQCESMNNLRNFRKGGTVAVVTTLQFYNNFDTLFDRKLTPEILKKNSCLFIVKKILLWIFSEFLELVYSQKKIKAKKHVFEVRKHKLASKILNKFTVLYFFYYNWL